MGGRIIARGIALGIAAMLLIAGLAALWVWFYSVAIDPGHAGAFYQAYGQRVAPFAAILAGLPLLLAAGWLAARGTGLTMVCLIPAATYVLLDLALSAAGGAWPPLWAMALSWLSKFAAAWAGGLLAQRKRAA